MTVELKQSARDSDRNNIRPMPLPRGGGSGSCFEVDAIMILGKPIGGTLKVLIDVGEGDTESKTVSFPFDGSESESELSNALLEHSGIEEGDFQIIGGPLNYAAMFILWKGNLAGRVMPVPQLILTHLEGTHVSAHTWKASSINWNGY